MRGMSAERKRDPSYKGVSFVMMMKMIMDNDGDDDVENGDDEDDDDDNYNDDEDDDVCYRSEKISPYINTCQSLPCAVKPVAYVTSNNAGKKMGARIQNATEKTSSTEESLHVRPTFG
eukprot:scaffold180012_cov19-Tisochrysis_lutea.AAC.1